MIASMVASLRAESGQDPTTSRRYSKNLMSHCCRSKLARMERLPANPFLEVDNFIAFAPIVPSTVSRMDVFALIWNPTAVLSGTELIGGGTKEE
jgi:hypothetical protein